MRHVLIVGGGAAGLLASIAAAEQGAHATVLERLPRVGAKLAATGGGRGNLCNRSSPAAFMEAFGREGRFMEPALQTLGRENLCKKLAELGVPTHAPDGFHVFPVCESAARVRDLLAGAAQRLGVDIREGVRVESLALAGGHCRGVCLENGVLKGDAVILCAGGKSWPALGSDGSGLAMAAAGGHCVIQPLPALAPLLLDNAWALEIPGVSLENVALCLQAGRQKKVCAGELVFTHAGISGPAALNISGTVSRAVQAGRDFTLSVDFMPGLFAADGQAAFAQWRMVAGAKTLRRLLAQWVPAALAERLCAAAGLPENLAAAHLSATQAKTLWQALKQMPLAVAGLAGFNQSMVTSGGLALKEVAPHTLASRLIPGLFFAGEILNLDGPCGGYNLHWAFASGWLAGRAAAVYA